MLAGGVHRGPPGWNAKPTHAKQCRAQAQAALPAPHHVRRGQQLRPNAVQAPWVRLCQELQARQGPRAHPAGPVPLDAAALCIAALAVGRFVPTRCGTVCSALWRGSSQGARRGLLVCGAAACVWGAVFERRGRPRHACLRGGAAAGPARCGRGCNSAHAAASPGRTAATAAGPLLPAIGEEVLQVQGHACCVRSMLLLRLQDCMQM